MAQKTVVKEGRWVAVQCAYCRGKGKDPFGVPYPKSNCCVCGGKGTVRVQEPYIVCAFCQGTSMHPHRRLICTVCKGKGVVTVRRPPRERRYGARTTRESALPIDWPKQLQQGPPSRVDKASSASHVPVAPSVHETVSLADQVATYITSFPGVKSEDIQPSLVYPRRILKRCCKD